MKKMDETCDVPAESHTDFNYLLTLMCVITCYSHSCLKWFALLSCQFASHSAWQPSEPSHWGKHNALVGLYGWRPWSCQLPVPLLLLLLSLLSFKTTGFSHCISSWQELTAHNLLQQMSTTHWKLSVYAWKKHVDFIIYRLSGVAVL